MINKYYIYAYLDPRKPGEYIYGGTIFDYEPFYIGKGTGDRYLIYTHMNQNRHLDNKIKKIKKEGFLVKIEFVQKNLVESEAFKQEIYFIGCIGRNDKGMGPLCNMTDGGEGASGKPGGMLGKKLSIEVRTKISKALKGRPGKPHSEETKNKLAAASTGKTQSRELINKRMTARKGYRHSEKTKSKISDSLKGHPASKGNMGTKYSDDVRRKLSESHKGKKQSEEQIRKKSLGLKRAWSEGKFKNRKTPKEYKK